MAPSNLEILASETTSLGLLCLRRRKLLGAPGTTVTEVTLDHELLMSSLNTASERALASHALELRPGDSGLDVLVGGLGLGYTAREVLRSDRVASLDVVEFLPDVIRWLERGLLPLAGELSADPRLAVSEGDVYEMLSRPPERTRDLILIDVDHSPDAPLARANAPFYGRDGLAAAKAHLRPQGVLGVWSSADNPAFCGALRSVFDRVSVERVTFRNDLVGGDETDWLFFARD